MKKQSVKNTKHKRKSMKMKKMNTSKSKKGKKRSYRKDNNRARGITSSKPKNKNPFEKLYDLENQQNIMTILEKMVAIKEIDPENTVVTISGETIRKKPKDMSPKELKSVLHLLNVDTKNALEKSELVTLLENEFKKTSNSKIDKTFVDTIQKKRQLLLKHLKEEEERQRVENLKKQKIAEEQRRRDEEHRRLKEEEKRKKREEEERQQRDEFDEQVREAKEWDRYNTQRELEQQQMENPYYRTSYRSQYPYPSSSHSYVPPYPPSSYYYEQQEAQRQLNEIPIELRYGHKYSDKSSKNFFGGK